MTSDELRDLSDEELVGLACQPGQRDDRPFAELFRRYHRKVWSLCYRYFPNRAEADDLTQEAFLRAYQTLPSFQGRSAFGSWLYRVTMNLCHNEHRYRSRRPQASEEPIDTAEVSSEESGPSAPERLMRDQRLARLQAALSTLKPADREILRLIDFEDMTYADAAHELSISLSAAKMRSLRARQALKAAFELG